MGYIVLWVGVRRIFSPGEEIFLNDDFRVCKEKKYDGNLLVTRSRLTHACVRRQGAERECEKETQMC